jgi:hypothetical protein
MASSFLGHRVKMIPQQEVRIEVVGSGILQLTASHAAEGLKALDPPPVGDLHEDVVVFPAQPAAGMHESINFCCFSPWSSI